MEVAEFFIDQGVSIEFVLKTLELSRSSFYYTPNPIDRKVGRAVSTTTLLVNGKWVSNVKVISDIKHILSQEFVDYGYLKITYELNDEDYQYVINPKKVYRLMKENDLLNHNKPKLIRSPREWVKSLVPQAFRDFSYWEIDIKYIYIQGADRNALLLTVIDVVSRWNLGHIMEWNIDYSHVIRLIDAICRVYPLPKKVTQRNDNGSQFECNLVRQYLIEKGIYQEFIRPATPEQNAHIEAYHSIVERTICQQYELDTLKMGRETMDRFKQFYNFKRRHSGLEYRSPYRYFLDKGIDMKAYLELWS
jgi:transposase InsO family protein